VVAIKTIIKTIIIIIIIIIIIVVITVACAGRLVGMGRTVCWDALVTQGDEEEEEGLSQGGKRTEALSVHTYTPLRGY
jgi:flagellar basal body-associated protein FliL